MISIREEVTIAMPPDVLWPILSNLAIVAHWHAGPFSTSSLSYFEVARWLSAFRTYGSRSNS